MPEAHARHLRVVPRVAEPQQRAQGSGAEVYLLADDEGDVAEGAPVAVGGVEGGQRCVRVVVGGWWGGGGGVPGGGGGWPGRVQLVELWEVDFGAGAGAGGRALFAGIALAVRWGVGDEGDGRRAVGVEWDSAD